MNNPIVPTTKSLWLGIAAEVAEAIEPVASSTPGVRISYTVVTHQADPKQMPYVNVSASTWGNAIPFNERIITGQECAYIMSAADIPEAVEKIESFCRGLQAGDSDV